MSGYRNPKSICEYANSQEVEDGTTARAETHPPSSTGLHESLGAGVLPGAWDWSGQHGRWTASPTWPAMLPRAAALLRNYKDSWVRGHRAAIKRASAAYGLPPELLAGIAWVETGGKGELENMDARGWGESEPLEQMDLAEFDGGADFDRVREQVESTAGFIGLHGAEEEDVKKLFGALQVREEGLSSTAKYLWELKEIDFAGETLIGPEEMRVIAARFYRGPQWSLEEIEADFSYGDLIVDTLLARLKRLLQDRF